MTEPTTDYNSKMKTELPYDYLDKFLDFYFNNEDHFWSDTSQPPTRVRSTKTPSETQQHGKPSEGKSSSATAKKRSKIRSSNAVDAMIETNPTVPGDTINNSSQESTRKRISQKTIKIIKSFKPPIITMKIIKEKLAKIEERLLQTDDDDDDDDDNVGNGESNTTNTQGLSPSTFQEGHHLTSIASMTSIDGSSSPTLSASTTNASIFSKSFKHNLLCSQQNKRLSNLNNVSNPEVSGGLIDELNLVDLRLLTKKEKKILRSKNAEKYHVNFSKAEFDVKAKNFGVDWNRAHRAMVNSDWERIKFLANPPSSSIAMNSKTSVLNSATITAETKSSPISVEAPFETSI